MNLFEMIKLIFDDKKDEWKKLKRSDKAGNAFMTNRIMSINFPIQAQQMNRNGIDGSAIVDTWKLVGSRFNRVPGWIWTKSKPSNKKEKVWKPDPEIAKFYMKKNNIGPRELDEIIKYNTKEIKDYFKKIEKQLNVHS